jgi:hypothetical protein
MQSLKDGMFPNGKVRFVGYVSCQEKISCSLNVVFNTRQRVDPTSERVQVVTFRDSDMTKDVKTIFKKQKTNQTSGVISVEELTKGRTQSSNYNWGSYNKSGYAGQWNKETGNNSNNSNKTKSTYICRFGAEQKFIVTQNREPLWQGCEAKFFDEFPVGNIVRR